MSITILYEGQRKKFKINTTHTVNQIIEDVSSSYNLDSLRCSLLHNNKTLERTQLFSHTGVSNNAVLTLNVSKSKLGGNSYKIALAAEGIGSKIDTFRFVLSFLSLNQFDLISTCFELFCFDLI